MATSSEGRDSDFRCPPPTIRMPGAGASKGWSSPTRQAGWQNALHNPVTVSSNLSATLTAPNPKDPKSLESDPDLLALPAPPKQERTATVILMVFTALAAAAMALSLTSEARYALSPGQPVEIGDLVHIPPGADLANRYVSASGLLGAVGAIRYGRAADGDSFRLAPVAGNRSVWVEIRVPEGFEGPRFVPPSTFAGRLVPFRQAGVRHVGLVKTVRAQTDMAVPDDAWLLVDGASPRASRWAVALAVLFAGFSAWNLAGIILVFARIRDREEPTATSAPVV